MSDDLIDRQYAIATAITGRTREIDGERWIRTSEVRESLKRCPSVEPKRKTGRWNKDRLTALNGGSYEVFRCSECQSAFNWRMQYCGHCGAKMEEEHDG